MAMVTSTFWLCNRNLNAKTAKQGVVLFIVNYAFIDIVFCLQQCQG